MEEIEPSLISLSLKDVFTFKFDFFCFHFMLVLVPYLIAVLFVVHKCWMMDIWYYRYRLYAVHSLLFPSTWIHAWFFLGSVLLIFVVCCAMFLFSVCSSCLLRAQFASFSGLSILECSFRFYLTSVYSKIYFANWGRNRT